MKWRNKMKNSFAEELEFEDSGIRSIEFVTSTERSIEVGDHGAYLAKVIEMDPFARESFRADELEWFRQGDEMSQRTMAERTVYVLKPKQTPTLEAYERTFFGNDFDKYQL
jgi:hypothetical protein